MTQIKRSIRWLINYLRESRREMQKVNWPTRAEVLRMTLVVLFFSALVAGILGGFDFLFTRAVFWVLPGDSTTAPVPTSGEPTINIEDEGSPIEVAPQTEPPQTP